MRKFLATCVLGTGLGTLAGFPALADDTEIYLQPPLQNQADAPLVMFSLDYRANLTSTICAQVGVGTPDLNGNFDALDYPSCEAARYFANKGLASELPAATDKFFFFDLLRLALRVVLESVNNVKLGLMMNHQHETNADGPSHGDGATGGDRKSNGGTIVMGFQLLEENNDTARDNFNTKLNALRALKSAPNSPDHTYQGKELFFEFYRYLTGKAVYNGHNGWNDFEQGATELGSPPANTNMACGSNDALLAEACWDSSIVAGAGNNFTYISPLTNANQCTKIYTINLFFGVSQNANDSDNAVDDPVVSGGTGAARTTDQAMIQFLRDADLGSTPFGTPDIAGAQSVQSFFLYNGNVANTVNSFAAAGGTDLGLEVTNDPEQLVNLLRSVFTQILSISTTFVAASVPVNVFNRAEVIDNVYIAVFQAQNKPNWPGNVKKVKIQTSVDNQGATVFRLVDASSPQIDAVATDGRIKNEALTFWTDGGALPAPAPDTQEVAGKDGRAVQRGGAGQKIPGFLSGGVGVDNAAGPRQVFTEPAAFTNGTPAALFGISANNAGFNALKAHFSPQQAGENNNEYEDRITGYLKWLRGMDLFDTDADGNFDEPRFMTLLKANGDPNGVIQWILHDALHSRPVAINFGARAGHTEANPDLRILMGTNDGMLHMFRNTNAGGTELGTETWGFVPRELLKLSETLSPVAAGGAHPYGLDGAVSVYLDDTDGDGTIEGGEQAIAVFGLRRGGQSMYALDITNPDSPQMLWKVTNGAGTFAELGHTFSSARVGTVKFGATPTPAVIFAAGYDLDKDARPGPGTDDNLGTAIYILDVRDGSLIKKFTHASLTDSISSDLSAIDTLGSGNFDRIYVGTTGGHIWRADLPPGAVDNRGSWSLSLLADLGRHQTNDIANDRRFHHRVDVVQSFDAQGSFDAVIVTSGDRENPRNEDTNDFIFVIKDPNTTSGVVDLTQAGNGRTDIPINFGQLGDVTDNCLQSGAPGCTTDVTKGFKLELAEVGEKGLATPTTIAGTIFFTTYIPNTGLQPSPCAPIEGTGRLYAISLENGGSRFNFNTQDDSNPDATEEGLTRGDRYLDLRSGGIPAEVVILPPDKLLLPDLSIISTGGTGNFPTFWYQIEDINSPN